jgi:hypothetical protein
MRALRAYLRSIARCFYPICNVLHADCATSGLICKTSAPLAENRCLLSSILLKQVELSRAKS